MTRDDILAVVIGAVVIGALLGLLFVASLANGWCAR